MAKTITIIGSGMMGSALAFPARENGHEVRLVGTHLDREIIEAAEQKAADAAVCMVTDGPDLAMNRYNTPKKKKKKKKAEPVTDAGQESIEKGSMEQEAPGQDTAIISSPENGQ